jgi:AcrR family transcriptional regulator
LKGKDMPDEQNAKRQVRDAEVMPAWKRNSVERSLTSARERAQDRSDRFVAAAMELMQERGTTDFTVQEVIDHSRMSIRTFYKFFASKDDLLVAVHDTILATEVVPRLRRRCEAASDPVERVRAYIEGLYDLTADRNPASRALSTFRSRLAETRPSDLEQTMRPQIEFVVELVRGVAETGRLKSDLAPDTAGLLMHHTVLAAVHARILGSDALSAQDLWRFCASGIGVAYDDPSLH